MLFELFKKKSGQKELRPGHSFRPDQTVAFASDLCIGPDRKRVRYMRRDAFFLKLRNHTGWILFSGEESAEVFRDTSRVKLVYLPSFIREDPSLGPVIDSPVGAEWTRSEAENIWHRIVNGQVVDQDGKVIGVPDETYLRARSESA